MRVTTIPDNEIWAGACRIVMGPPAGHDPTGEIRAVPASGTVPAAGGESSG